MDVEVLPQDVETCSGLFPVLWLMGQHGSCSVGSPETDMAQGG